MAKLRILGVVLAFVVGAAPCVAADDAPALLIAKGIIEKVDKDSLTILPREAGGKFGKGVTLRLTGTSKLSQLTMEKRGGKVVPVQRDIDAKELHTKHGIAIIYTTGAAGAVVLAAVVQPDGEK